VTRHADAVRIRVVVPHISDIPTILQVDDSNLLVTTLRVVTLDLPLCGTVN
jgi:hypothetical protein